MLSLTLMLCILSRLPWDPVRTILSLFFSPCLQSLSLDNLRPMADDAERGARGKKNCNRASSETHASPIPTAQLLRRHAPDVGA